MMPNGGDMYKYNPALVAFLVTLLFGCSSDDAEKEAKVTESQNAPVEVKELALVVFDIASLVGKPVDEIREILGKPQDKEPEPTELQLQIGFDEWSNVFTKDGQELLVTFNPRTRQVIDFFLAGENKIILIQQGNLVEATLAYTIEPVNAIRNPSEITGIKIIPAR
jgi:hypothetical protein